MKSNLSGSMKIVKILGILIFITACTPVPFANTPTANIIPPTSTTLPTKTLMPTLTLIPPTPTIAAPDKISEYLNDVRVVHVETFDNPSQPGWSFDAGIIKNGVLEVIGDNWRGLLRETSFKENQGILIDFTYTKGSVFEMLLDYGEWWTEPYKRFGIYIDNNNPRVNVWVGQNGLGGAILNGDLSLQPDTTYSLLMTVLPDGGFLGVIWDPSDPLKTRYYHESIGHNWSNLTWTFKIGGAWGTIQFDNYKEIVFSNIR